MVTDTFDVFKVAPTRSKKVTIADCVSIGVSQGGKGTKVDVYLPYRGAISFYVYIVPSGLISIFQDVVCDKISCGLQPTRFFLNFL